MVEDWIHWSHYWYFFSLGWVRIWDDASFVDEYDVDSIWGCWDSKVVLSNNGLYRPHTKVFLQKPPCSCSLWVREIVNTLISSESDLT